MDELVKLVARKSGIGEAQAKKAVDTVMDFLKDKLPAPVATQIVAVLSQEGTIKQAEQLMDKGMDVLGGLLSKK